MKPRAMIEPPALGAGFSEIQPRTAQGRLLHRDWSLYDTAHAVFRHV